MSRDKAKKLAVAGFTIGAIGLLMVVAGIVVESRSVDFNPAVVLLWMFGGLLFFLGLPVFARGAVSLREQLKS